MGNLTEESRPEFKPFAEKGSRRGEEVSKKDQKPNGKEEARYPRYQRGAVGN